MSLLLALASQSSAPDTSMIRILSGVGALVIIVVIVMRRKSKKKKDQDEF